jgi:hypothetical protein
MNYYHQNKVTVNNNNHISVNKKEDLNINRLRNRSIFELLIKKKVKNGMSK